MSETVNAIESEYFQNDQGFSLRSLKNQLTRKKERVFYNRKRNSVEGMRQWKSADTCIQMTVFLIESAILALKENSFPKSELKALNILCDELTDDYLLRSDRLSSLRNSAAQTKTPDYEWDLDADPIGMLSMSAFMLEDLEDCLLSRANRERLHLIRINLEAERNKIVTTSARGFVDFNVFI